MTYVEKARLELAHLGCEPSALPLSYIPSDLELMRPANPRNLVVPGCLKTQPAFGATNQSDWNQVAVVRDNWTPHPEIVHLTCIGLIRRPWAVAICLEGDALLNQASCLALHRANPETLPVIDSQVIPSHVPERQQHRISGFCQSRQDDSLCETSFIRGI
jgi:hypothetical protein